MKEHLEILTTPQISIINSSYTKFDNLEIQTIVETFRNILENNFKEEDLYMFYRNISTLKIKQKHIILEFINSLFKETRITGLYHLYKNEISVLPIQNNTFINKYIGIDMEEYIASMYHELLHMSSTILDKEKNTVFSGFYQIGNTNIGIALDDGYTELLLHRHFNIKKEYITYLYEYMIAKNIERIITKEKMTSLYFKADLYNLIGILEEYSNITDTENFIKDLDTLYFLEDYSSQFKEDIIHYHNKISEYIINTYKKKLTKELKENSITTLGYNKRLEETIKSIHRAYKYLELEEKTKVRRK